jgi:hypothetical protein
VADRPFFKHQALASSAAVAELELVAPVAIEKLEAQPQMLPPLQQAEVVAEVAAQTAVVQLLAEQLQALQAEQGVQAQPVLLEDRALI